MPEILWESRTAYEKDLLDPRRLGTLTITTWNVNGGDGVELERAFDHDPDLIGIAEAHRSSDVRRSTLHRMAEAHNMVVLEEVPLHRSHITPECILTMGILATEEFARDTTTEIHEMPQPPRIVIEGATPHQRPVIAVTHKGFPTFAFVNNWPLERFAGYSYNDTDGPAYEYAQDLANAYVSTLSSYSYLILGGDNNFGRETQIDMAIRAQLNLTEYASYSPGLFMDVTIPTVRDWPDAPDRFAYTRNIECYSMDLRPFFGSDHRQVTGVFVPHMQPV